MGRKPKKEPGAAVKAMDKAVQKYEEHQLSIQEVEEQFGDGQPYERLRLENEVRFYQQQTAESLIQIGRRLIRIKANEEHGGFLQVLENLGMAERSSQYAMTAARKFGNTPALAYLGNTKVKALTVLDDDSIQTLENGGMVKGVTLDEIEKMTTKELRETLRKERDKRKKEKTAQEDAIAKKEEKINELEQQLRYQEPPTKEQLAEVALRQYRDPIIDNLIEATERIQRVTTAIDEAQKIPHIPFEALEKLIQPWWGSFETFLEAAEDFGDAFKNIHVDKGRG